MKIAAIGECLIELTRHSDNLMALDYAGDTYNTCYYLAQLNKQSHIAYMTAVGDDPNSQTMLQTWEKVGIKTNLCLKFKDKIPGLYLVNTNESGERTFYYYRNQSAASQILNHPNVHQNLTAIFDYDYLYLTGISFAILAHTDRMALFDFIKSVKQRGVGIIYDNNYRPQLWANQELARNLVDLISPLINILFVTHEDEQLLFGDVDSKATLRRYQASSSSIIVVKDGANCCLVSDNGEFAHQSPSAMEKVIDTTGAGDAFNAGFLNAYWRGNTIEEALKHAHSLAAEVIQHPGAILPTSHFEQKTGFANRK